MVKRIAILLLLFLPSVALAQSPPSAVINYGGGSGSGSGGGSGTVTSIATNNGLTGGTITTTGTLGLASVSSGTGLCNNTGSSGAPTAANCSLTFPAFTDTLALVGIGGVISSNGTTTSPTATQFNNNCPLYTVNATTATFNIPAASTLQASGGCMLISNPSANTYTLTPNGTDNLNGANSSATEPAQSFVVVTTNGTADFVVVPTSASFTGGNVANATTFQANGAASASPVLLNGTTFAGTGTTSFPTLFVQPTAASASTTWNTGGTAIGANVTANTTDPMNLMVAGSSVLRVSGFGQVIAGSVIYTSPGGGFCFGFSASRSCITSPSDGFLDGFASNGTTYASLDIAAIIAKGATPTLTGTCTTSTKTGGQTAGTFVATCTAQTVIITFAITSPTGWDCSAQDRTTVADTLKQTASSATSCTLSGTTVASDVIGWHAIGY